MSLRTRIVRNVLSNWASHLIYMVVAFFMSPFVVHRLGQTGYGVWVLVGSLTGYLGLLDFGLRPAIVKFVSRYHALENDKKVNEVINTTLVIFTLVAGVVAVASVVLAFLSPRILKVPPEYHRELQIIILIVGFQIAVSFPFGVYNAVINALQRFDLNNFINISILFVRTALIVVFLRLGGGLIALGVITLAASVAEFTLKRNACKRILPALTITPQQANRETLKMIFSFSAYTFLISIGFQLSFFSDSIVIGAFLSAGAITCFAIGANLIQYLTTLVSNITVTITPVASTFEAHQNHERMRQLLLVGTKYCLLVILPVGFAYLVLGETFVNLWMGPEFGPDSSRVLRILMIAYFGYLSQLVSVSIFYGLGKIKRLAFLMLGAAIANVIISVALVNSMGIFGVAWGTAIPLFIYGTIIVPVYICRTLQVNILLYIKRSFLPPLLASIPYLALIICLDRFMAVDSLAEFALVIAGACAVYGASGFLIALEPDHRRAVLAKCKALLSKIFKSAA